MKPSWGYDGTLVYAAPTNAKPFKRSSRRAREKTEKNDLLSDKKIGVVSQSRDVRFAKFSDEVCIHVEYKLISLLTFSEFCEASEQAQDLSRD
jgi:hypothetical protein